MYVDQKISGKQQAGGKHVALCQATNFMLSYPSRSSPDSEPLYKTTLYLVCTANKSCLSSTNFPGGLEGD